MSVHVPPCTKVKILEMKYWCRSLQMYNKSKILSTTVKLTPRADRGSCNDLAVPVCLERTNLLENVIYKSRFLSNFHQASKQAVMKGGTA